MPYSSVYIDGGYGVLKTGSGVVTGEQILSSARELSRDELRLGRLVYGLVDFSAVEEMRVTPVEVRLLIEIQRRTSVLVPGALVSIFAPDPLAFGISRFWQSFSPGLGWKALVCHTRLEAIEWLRKEIPKIPGSALTLDRFPTLQAS